MGVISTVILCLILLCIIWFVQQSLSFAAYRFYPFVALGILIAVVFLFISPREATRWFIQIGQHFAWVLNSILKEACYQGATFTCPWVGR
jgi:hypothetical protein